MSLRAPRTRFVVLYFCCIIGAAGCAHQSQTKQISSAHVPELDVQALSLFSTYASDAMRLQCQQNAHTCHEDAIPPDTFLDTLRDAGNADTVHASSSQSADYELLIANLGRETTPSVWQSLFSQRSPDSMQYAEFTLTWRGIELSSLIVSGRFPATADAKAKARHLIGKWWNAVENKRIFSARYLYTQLNASNYDDELRLPESIDTFRQSVTELYPDPLEGVISRYTHPDYQDALVDINVYPIRQSLSNDTARILDDELNNDLAQAEKVADARALTLELIHTAEDTDVATLQGKGRRLALQASSPTSDTIYASIYAFRLKDKIVKITTTMPPRFSDALVSKAIPHIQVPKESGLMSSLRANSTQGGS
ncbi:hypothetical protein [Alteromonas halophila]|uniref:Uncharacterized protein n=1 Tax=Alteromonas halophila TaxID=516698 RepID=A0A918MY12_9ALTE|nr:hypothetical protein [Alteromonas halophila]GGW86423.1 hypothetical protein GCM10007391_20130 [Alteromonas halophila]